MSLADTKTVAEITQAVITSIGIVLAGVWTYLVFIRKREWAQRARVSHEVSSVALTDSRRLLRVAATIENTGSRLLRLKDATIRIQQVRPVPGNLSQRLSVGLDLVATGEREIAWPQLGERCCSWKDGHAEIEPGETETLDADFIVDPAVEAVVVYTYVTNVAKSSRPIGWSRTTLHNLLEVKTGNA